MSESGDIEAIDKLVARFYSAFDNTRSAPQQPDIVGCFAEGARVVRYSGGKPEFYSVVEFAQPRIALLTGDGLVGFSECEISSRTEQFAGIASRTSHYRKSGMLHGEPYAGAGAKLFHFVRLADGWRICGLSWVDAEA